ncbi:hypothetical protein F0A16_14980 [Salinicola corii]|uniref:Uncharacterized protein n=1 Tax=Salinicola corii TaxID=2606937 RepID=A0A640WAS0_9GAMM|nr:hypothetical protein [Salinicola corii]KAA0017297.1 hypothetical protein F0A16_14980 [Salinicola corii]
MRSKYRIGWDLGGFFSNTAFGDDDTPRPGQRRADTKALVAEVNPTSIETINDRVLSRLGVPLVGIDPAMTLTYRQKYVETLVSMTIRF